MLEHYDRSLISEIDASLTPAEVMLEILKVVTGLEFFKDSPKV